MMLRILVVLLAFGIGLPLTVTAQGFKPTRPVEVIVHTGPGGGNDVLARAIATIVEKEKLLSVRMQVVNKTGGGGLTAMAYLVEKKGESHSIALFANTWFTVPVITAEAKVTMNDLTPIARLVVEPAVVAVKNDAPYKSLKDFIDAAKASPGQLKQSGGSIGSRDWVMHQLLMKHTRAAWKLLTSVFMTLRSNRARHRLANPSHFCRRFGCSWRGVDRRSGSFGSARLPLQDDSRVHHIFSMIPV